MESNSSQKQVVNFQKKGHSCGCSHQDPDYEWAITKTSYKVYLYKNVLQAISGFTAGLINNVLVPILMNGN